MTKRPVADLLLGTAAGFSLIGASFANLLRSNDYPLLRLEVGIVAALILLTAVLAAFLYRRERRLGKSLLEGILVIAAIDLMTGTAAYAFPAGIVAILVSFFLRVSLLPAAAMMGGVMLGTTLLGVGGHQRWVHSEEVPPAPATEAQRTMILHLILDEHLGVEGFPAQTPEQRQLKRDVKNFYADHGFTVFGRAYSEHIHTANSVPFIMNYGTMAGEKHGQDRVVLGPTAHMKELARAGYRVHVLQSDFADFCADGLQASCTTYSYQSLRPTLSLPMRPVERARLLAVRYASGSSIAGSVDLGLSFLGAVQPGLRSALLGLPLELRSRTSSIASLAAFDLLIDAVRRGRPGDVYLAHLLIPHFPYVFDANCRLIDRDRWESRSSPSPTSVREQAYGDQLRCTMRKVEQVLAAAAESSGGSRLVVILHGDHGSRILETYPYAADAERVSGRDLVAGHSTLFAIRAPGIAPGYVEESASVADLLEGFTKGEFRTVPSGPHQPPAVHLADPDWTPRKRVPLPPGW